MNKICYKCKQLKPIIDFSTYKVGKNKGYKSSYCKNCRCLVSREIREKNPWIKTYGSILARCNTHGRPYNKKGIKVAVTKEQIRDIWFRDKAYLMDKPSIDRIDPKKDYEYSNCRFIELRVNQSNGSISRWKMVRENKKKATK